MRKVCSGALGATIAWLLASPVNAQSVDLRCTTTRTDTVLFTSGRTSVEEFHAEYVINLNPESGRVTVSSAAIGSFDAELSTTNLAYSFCFYGSCDRGASPVVISRSSGEFRMTQTWEYPNPVVQVSLDRIETGMCERYEGPRF